MLKPFRDRTTWAFLAGFGLCYLAGAYLCFNLLLTLHYPVDDALYRSAVWWQTANDASAIAASRLRRDPRGFIVRGQ